MKKSNAQIIHHFYSLLLEMNFHEDEDDILTQDDQSDPFLQKHLRLIKLKTAKNRAELKKRSFHSIMEEIDKLRKIGVEELNKLLTPKEVIQLQPLFSKFESLSKKDKESIEEDEELIHLLVSLKNKLDKADTNDQSST